MQKVVRLILFVVVFLAFIHSSKAGGQTYCNGGVGSNCQATTSATVASVSTLSNDDTEVLGTIEYDAEEEEESVFSAPTVDVSTLSASVLNTQIQNTASSLTQTSTQEVPPLGYEIEVYKGVKYCKTSCEWFADLQVIGSINNVAPTYKFNPGQLCGSCIRPYFYYLLSSINQSNCYSIADIQAGHVPVNQLNLVKTGCSLPGVCSCTNTSIQNPAQLTLLSKTIKIGQTNLMNDLIANMSSIAKQMQKQYNVSLAKAGDDLAPVVSKIIAKYYELEDAYEAAYTAYEENPTWPNYDAYVAAYDTFYAYYEIIETLYNNANQPLSSVAGTYTTVFGDMNSKMLALNHTVSTIASRLLSQYGQVASPTVQQILSVTQNITSWSTSLINLTNQINRQAIATFNSVVAKVSQSETKATVEEVAASVQFYHKKIQALHSSRVASETTHSNSIKVV